MSLLEIETFGIQEYSPIASALTDLRAKYAGVIYDVKSESGMKAAVEARNIVRKHRTELDRVRKSVKEESLRRGQAIDREAKILAEQIAAVEDPIAQQISDEIRRVEDERKAKEEAEAAERQRVLDEKNAELARLQAQLDKIREEKEAAARAEQEAAAAELKRQEDERLAAERQAHAERMKREAEEMNARRAEQERLWAEQDRERQERQAELDRIAADARAERERLDREAAELRRKEQEAIDAERRRIQDERLEQERLDNQRLAAEMARMRAVIADIGNDAAMEPFLTAALNYRDADNERAEMESLLALCQLFRDALNSGSLVDNAALAGKGARR